MTRPKLFLAVPVYGGMEPLFVNSLLQTMLELQKRTPKPFDVTYTMKSGDSLVCRARNSLAQDFLASDCSHLLFVDSDLVFNLQHIEALLSRNADIIGGLYPKKLPKLEWVLNILDGQTEDDTGLLRVKYIGTGFMLIRRQVFERMIEAFPEIAFGADLGDTQGSHDFFSVGPRFDPASGYTRYLSEDWYFCQRASEIGIEVYADCRVVLQHIGQITYPLQDPFAPPPALDSRNTENGTRANPSHP